MSLSFRNSFLAADPNTKAARIRLASGRNASRSTPARPAVFANSDCSSAKAGEDRYA